MMDKSSLLLLMLAANNGAPIIGKTRFMKLMYLLDLDLKKSNFDSYEFQRDSHGPYSLQIKKDLDALIKDGYVSYERREDDSRVLVDVYSITTNGQSRLNNIFLQRDDISGENTIEYIKDTSGNIKRQYNDASSYVLGKVIYSRPELRELQKIIKKIKTDAP